jgi:MarR family transcriptional regulator, organic hydroperoxide resistance regulator
MRENREAKVADAERATGLLLLGMRLTHGLVAEAMKESGLRPPQIVFLGLLHHIGSLNMSSISHLTNVTLSVATRFIERLEKKGMVERVQDEKDRRVVLVRLTPEGSKLAENILKSYNERLKQALRGIDPKDIEVFLRVLGQINENLASELPMEALSGVLADHFQQKKEGCK